MGPLFLRLKQLFLECFWFNVFYSSRVGFFIHFSNIIFLSILLTLMWHSRVKKRKNKSFERPSERKWFHNLIVFWWLFNGFKSGKNFQIEKCDFFIIIFLFISNYTGINWGVRNFYFILFLFFFFACVCVCVILLQCVLLVVLVVKIYVIFLNLSDLNHNYNILLNFFFFHSFF